MRNIGALDAVFKLIDGVYADLIFRSREQKDSRKRKQEEKDIKELLSIRHRLVRFYSKMN